MGSVVDTDLPRPFYDQWPRRKRAAAHALWRWHSALAAAARTPPDADEASSSAFWDEEQARATAGEPLRGIPDAVCRDAYAACETHGLDRSLLVAQVGTLPEQVGTVRFETEADVKRFVGRWAVSHGRLLAGLADVTLSVQLDYVDELARGFFYLGRLLRLPADVEHDRLFLPLEALRQKGVSMEQLREGRVDEAVRGLLWKESVRVRDALAQGRPLLAGLSLRHRFALKRFWLGALEVLDEVERRDYDLWSRPLTLPLWRRVRVYLQIVFGRTTT